MSRTDRDGDGVVRFHTDFKDLFFHDYFKIFKKSDLEKKEPTNNLTQRINLLILKTLLQILIL